MEAIMQDLGGASKTGTLHSSILDVLGWDVDQAGPMVTQQLFTDPQSFSLGNSQTFYPAENLMGQINLRMSNVLLDLRRTYIVGRCYAPCGVINPSGFASMF